MGGGIFLKAEGIAQLATEAASQKQATNIVMLDAAKLCSFTDYFVICSGDSDRHIEAISQGINETMKNKGVIPHHKEGTPDSGWMLTDFGSVIVHIFTTIERDYYQLEGLWHKAIPIIRIQ